VDAAAFPTPTSNSTAYFSNQYVHYIGKRYSIPIYNGRLEFLTNLIRKLVVKILLLTVCKIIHLIAAYLGQQRKNLR